MSIVAIRHSAAIHKAQAQQYLSEGLYDEAMQSYQHSFLRLGIFEKTVHLFGEFNAFLTTLGILLIFSGLLIKRKRQPLRIKQVRITRPFNWIEN